jgi:FemAB-related protein (PEP-CTERM system-associated)
VFPIVELRSALFGWIACSMPFVNYGGPCGDNEEIEHALLDAAHGLAEEWRVDYLEIRSRRHLGDRYPFAGHKISLTIDLEREADKLWDSFKTGQRQEIRRGYKNGFIARFGGADLLSDFYLVLAESWRDLGTPIFSKSYLDQICTVFSEAIRICVVYDSFGNPAAGAFMGLHNGTVEGMWLGIRSVYRRELVGYVLYWELIKHACEHGEKVLHLGRSTVDSGAVQFKKKWNATATQLYWHYLLRRQSEIPQLNVSNGKFRMARAAWRRLPVSVAQRIGPMIARSIP